MLRLLKKYYLLITIIIFIAGLSIDYFSREVVPKENYRYYLDSDQKLKTEVFYTYEYKYIILHQISEFLYSIAISLFIALFILKHFEDIERIEYEKQLLSIQKNINKDVLTSVFERFIHPSVFKTIKNDLFNFKTYRTNALWIFDFKQKGNGIELTKTIIYEIVNEQENTETEEIYLRDYQFDFYKSSLKYIKYQIGEKIEENRFDDSLEFNEKNFVYKKHLKIPPKSIAKVTQIILNEYSTSDIYGTFTTNHPIIGLKIICTIPEGFNLHIFSTFKYHLDRLTSQSDQEQIFYYDSAILSGQSLHFFLVKNI